MREIRELEIANYPPNYEKLLKKVSDKFIKEKSHDPK